MKNFILRCITSILRQMNLFEKIYEITVIFTLNFLILDL